MTDISGVKINITIIKINPDSNRHIPEISNGEYFFDNLAKKNTANAKDIAEIIASISPNEFQQNLVRSSEPQKTTLAAGLFGQTSNQKELARVLLLAVLALLFIELFWANRTLA